MTRLVPLARQPDNVAKGLNAGALLREGPTMARRAFMLSGLAPEPPSRQPYGRFTDGGAAAANKTFSLS